MEGRAGRQANARAKQSCKPIGLLRRAVCGCAPARRRRGFAAMKTEFLYRLAGLASLLAGSARIVAALPWSSDATLREALYDTIDALLLFAVMGLYFSRKDHLGILGLTSFAVAIGALSFIGGPDADPFGF